MQMLFHLAALSILTGLYCGFAVGSITTFWFFANQYLPDTQIENVFSGLDTVFGNINTLNGNAGILSSNLLVGVFASSIPFGIFLGFTQSALFIDVFRRRVVLLIVTIVFGIGSTFGFIFLNTWYLFVAFRVASGFCAGIYMAIVPIYVSEYAFVFKQILIARKNQFNELDERSKKTANVLASGGSRPTTTSNQHYSSSVERQNYIQRRNEKILKKIKELFTYSFVFSIFFVNLSIFLYKSIKMHQIYALSFAYLIPILFVLLTLLLFETPQFILSSKNSGQKEKELVLKMLQELINKHRLKHSRNRSSQQILNSNQVAESSTILSPSSNRYSHTAGNYGENKNKVIENSSDSIEQKVTDSLLESAQESSQGNRLFYKLLQQKYNNDDFLTTKSKSRTQGYNVNSLSVTSTCQKFDTKINDINKNSNSTNTKNKNMDGKINTEDSIVCDSKTNSISKSISKTHTEIDINENVVAQTQIQNEANTMSFSKQHFASLSYTNSNSTTSTSSSRFRNTTNFTQILILCIAQQFTGYTSFLYYFPFIITKTSPVYNKNIPAIAVLTVSILAQNFVLVYVAERYIRKYGRKLMITFGMILMAASNLFIGLVYWIFEADLAVITLIVFVLVFLIGYQMGLSSFALIVFQKEVVHNNFRIINKRLILFIEALSWVLNSIFTFLFYIVWRLIDKVNKSTGFIFICLSILTIIFILHIKFFVPEFQFTPIKRKNTLITTKTSESDKNLQAQPESATLTPIITR